MKVGVSLPLNALKTIRRSGSCRCCSTAGNSKNNQTKSKKFSDTIRLPNTSFPLSIRGKASTDRETEIQKLCGFDELYSWQQNQNREKTFVLHDGPPYANGKPHVGHALNKVLKDITCRYKLLRGYKVHYIPGWDCHGLPIELKALSSNQDFRTVKPLDIRSKARKFASKTIDTQRSSFKRYGIMADWNKPYLTMDHNYQANQLAVFYELYKKGYVYRDKMPVYWSTEARTALAESELEYMEDHVSQSVFVKFPLTQIPTNIQSLLGSNKKVYIVIWTTTPWTLPANQAVCYGPSLRYNIVKGTKTGDLFICGEKFLEKLKGLVNENLTNIAEITGQNLARGQYEMPLSNEKLPLLPADHVTSDKGTGLVHTAPAHGHDDFKLAKKHGLKSVCVVDENGLYTNDAGPQLKGMHILKEANPKVLSLLGDAVLRVEDFQHSYPYDWRVKQPVIIRESQQWFVNTESLKEKALKCLGNIPIYPKFTGRGMLSQITSRTYWCISRQRVWGVPIPVFYTQNDDVIINDDTFAHIQSLFQQHGSDCWWSMPTENLLPESQRKQLNVEELSTIRRGSDILDIWFDSGSSWYSVLKEVGYEADLYLEGVDQFGGWFLSSLLTSVALQGKPPYKGLLVHGFTMDEEGRKMSKSLGNVIDPEIIIKGGKNLKEEPAYGADILRWWVASSHLQTNIHIGPKILSQFHQTVFKMRKCLRFLLGNLSEFNVEKEVLPVHCLLPQDRYMLHQLHTFYTQCVSGYETFNYSRVIQAVEKFINAQVSNFYCNIIKDRCYCGTTSRDHYLSSLTVQYHILSTVTQIIAPILPHLAEELYLHFPWSFAETAGQSSKGIEEKVRSIFRQPWAEPDASWENPEVQRDVDAVLCMRDSVYSLIQTESPVEFDVILHTGGELLKVLKRLQLEQTSSTSPLCELFQTSQTSVIENPPEPLTDISEFVEGYCHLKEGEEGIHYTAIVIPAEKEACQRCHRYTANEKDSLCLRCLHVLKELSS